MAQPQRTDYSILSRSQRLRRDDPAKMAAHRLANRRYRQRINPHWKCDTQAAQNLLPLRVPCPTPMTSKIYLPLAGSVALSLLYRVHR